MFAIVALKTFVSAAAVDFEIVEQMRHPSVAFAYSSWASLVELRPKWYHSHRLPNVSICWVVVAEPLQEKKGSALVSSNSYEG